MSEKAAQTVLGAVYVHSKGGKFLVVAVGRNATNQNGYQAMVAYVALDNGQWFFRDETEFHLPVKWPDGTFKPRFMLGP